MNAIQNLPAQYLHPVSYTHLDVYKRQILDLLQELNKKDKITVIIVTHEADVAKRAQRQIKVVDGEIS